MRAWVRSGRSRVARSLPLTLGSYLGVLAHARDVEYVRSLGATEPADAKAERFEVRFQGRPESCSTRSAARRLGRSFDVLVPGDVLVSAAAPPDPEGAARRGARAEG